MKINRKKLRKRVEYYFSKYIRLRDCLETTGTKEYGICCTCGKVKEFKKLDAGHFVPGRKDPYIFVEENCHAQCRHCNDHRKGALLEYGDFMIGKYGKEKTEKIKLLRYSKKTLSIIELLALRDYYKNKVKEYEKV